MANQDDFYTQLGNYPHYKNAISVHGTFTVAPRPGRLKAIIKTLRYTKQGWRNKLGLRNPGLHAGMFKTSYDNVLSVSAIETSDWTKNTDGYRKGT